MYDVDVPVTFVIDPPEVDRLPHCLPVIVPPPVSATDTDVPLLPKHIDCAVLADIDTADKLTPTVPATATFLVVALVLANVMFPDGEPVDAVDCNLTYIVVDAIAPAAPITNADELVPILLANVELVDTSNPTGGVIVMPVDILEPVTVKFWVLDAVPEHEENADNVETEGVMTGLGVQTKVVPDTGLAVLFILTEPVFAVLAVVLFNQAELAPNVLLL